LGVNFAHVLHVESEKVNELTGSINDDVFDVSGWNGTGKLLGGLGMDKIVANSDVADMLLTDVLLTRTGRGSLTLSGFEDAVLTGGAAANKFTVKGFQGTVKLDGGDGSDTYQVNLPATGTVAVNVEDTGTTGTDVLRTAAVAVAPTRDAANRRVSYLAASVIYTSAIETEILPIKGTL
jgi:Ca2+-binding RTX toxin-like protein